MVALAPTTADRSSVSSPCKPEIAPVKLPAAFTVKVSLPEPPVRFSTFDQPALVFGTNVPAFAPFTTKAFPSASPTIVSLPNPPSIEPVNTPVLVKANVSAPSPPTRLKVLAAETLNVSAPRPPINVAKPLKFKVLPPVE